MTNPTNVALNEFDKSRAHAASTGVNRLGVVFRFFGGLLERLVQERPATLELERSLRYSTDLPDVERRIRAWERSQAR